jgi:hypothetical protein
LQLRIGFFQHLVNAVLFSAFFIFHGILIYKGGVRGFLITDKIIELIKLI